MLPAANLQSLEIGTRCGGPLLSALSRFSRLQALHITGDGGSVDWSTPGTAQAVPKLRKLRKLRLDSWDDPELDHALGGAPFMREVLPATLPAGTAVALAPATALHALHLHARWSSEVPALVRALPHLQQLGLEIMQCTTAQVEAAVALLSQLPAGAEASLAIHAHYYSEVDEYFHHWEADYDEVRVPPLSGLAAVTELRLIGNARLPHDLRQLPQLRSLVLKYSMLAVAEQWEMWGDETRTLSMLTALTHVTLGDCVLPDYRLLASAPALAAVRYTTDAHQASVETLRWAGHLSRLRPDVSVIV